MFKDYQTEEIVDEMVVGANYSISVFTCVEIECSAKILINNQEVLWKEKSW
jgi:hypothetical protein